MNFKIKNGNHKKKEHTEKMKEKPDMDEIIIRALERYRDDLEEMTR